jgi:hypothetical protein
VSFFRPAERDNNGDREQLLRQIDVGMLRVTPACCTQVIITIIISLAGPLVTVWLSWQFIIIFVCIAGLVYLINFLPNSTMQKEDSSSYQNPGTCM